MVSKMRVTPKFIDAASLESESPRSKSRYFGHCISNFYAKAKIPPEFELGFDSESLV